VFAISLASEKVIIGTQERRKKPIPCAVCDDYIPSADDKSPDELNGQCRRLLDLLKREQYSKADNLTLLIGLEVNTVGSSVFVTELSSKSPKKGKGTSMLVPYLYAQDGPFLYC